MGKFKAAVAAAILAGGMAAGGAAAASEAAAGTMTVWKSPSCGCCGAWIDHVKAAGFTVEVHDTEAMHVVKQMTGVPDALASCHTARIDGKMVEGHVPADALARFLKDTPEGAAGIAVPGMPIGSPGMEQGGVTEPYDIVTWGAGGTDVFESR